MKKLFRMHFASFSEKKNDSNIISKDYELFKLNSQTRTELIYESYKKHGTYIFQISDAKFYNFSEILPPLQLPLS